MPENLLCPHCFRPLPTRASAEGGEIRCPECQQIVTPGNFTANTPRPATTRPSDVKAGLPPVTVRATGDDDDTDRMLAGIRRREAGEYRSGAGLAQAVKILLGLNLLTGLAMVGSEYMQYELAKRLVARQIVPEAELHGNDLRQMMVGAVHTLVYLVTAIVFLVWFYRAYANLKPLGAHGLTHTPGGAVLGWFIPFLNLVRPVQVLQEIWRQSDPEAVRRKDTQLPGISGLIGVWWAMWLITNVVGGIVGRAGMSVTTPEGFQFASVAGMASEAVFMATALLAMAVVATIDSRQTARAEGLEDATAYPEADGIDAEHGQS
jgi:hypothetical protein